MVNGDSNLFIIRTYRQKMWELQLEYPLYEPYKTEYICGVKADTASLMPIGKLLHTAKKMTRLVEMRCNQLLQ